MELLELLAHPVRLRIVHAMSGGRVLTTAHHVSAAGVHGVKVWMVDPGVVLQKLIVHQGPVPPSYLGPPEAPAARDLAAAK